MKSPLRFSQDQRNNFLIWWLTIEISISVQVLFIFAWITKLYCSYHWDLWICSHPDWIIRSQSNSDLHSSFMTFNERMFQSSPQPKRELKVGWFREWLWKPQSPWPWSIVRQWRQPFQWFLCHSHTHPRGLYDCWCLRCNCLPHKYHSYYQKLDHKANRNKSHTTHSRVWIYAVQCFVNSSE
jgi:hypothetical protein